jgi:hypothetical protein
MGWTLDELRAVDADEYPELLTWIQEQCKESAT